jgi:hypothetical protein
MLDEEFEFPWIDPNDMIIPPEVVACVPGELARDENVMPLDSSEDVVTVALEDPLKFELID